ncbi:hypothetical protein Kpol_380p6 [Vanderwaltozyma polyspora DSM 70294]|uniref:Importin N-terminal domain-containing protein n=1 Tax=Vanderwaltozyma polyspora (strain ATCC 22028 / DSM 70294 / BCRC 21397 / CBS 2163 / NBRC 10782 / NRRL Y-8283 / UCD 57-17) TaxID=436907 RepID=A7TS65_VANPO|nr:uncharacterized protein Kpol_380p6 [Vanderwaltozyma polyspora DSM 70294]EDO14887.1 hypothetical protein Kpol_380p6 [Vanderwaltozyma polyspora DSM 70294]
MQDIHQLINLAQSPDNSVREKAESELLAACDEDACIVFHSMIQVGSNGFEELSSRLFALLTLRKLITMYWSPGFESYRLNSTLNEEIKNNFRDSLLKICLDDSQDTKIKNASAYCVVQISAVDFPDQWPTLLNEVYGAIMERHSLSAISLLNEIYDDVMSEEMFFEEGIGSETIRIIFSVLTDNNTGIAAKIASSKLFHSCLLQMSVLDPQSVHKRKQLVTECISQILTIWSGLLQKQNVTEMSSEFELRSKIYEDLAMIKSEFPRKLFSKENIEIFRRLVINDLNIAAKCYNNVLSSENSDTEMIHINEFVIHIIEFLTAISDFKFSPEDIGTISKSFVTLSCIDRNTEESWTADFNSFISKETGLFASFTIRDQIADFISNVNEGVYSGFYSLILNEFNEIINSNSDWRTQESVLYLLQCIATSETEINESLQCNTQILVTAIGNIISNPPTQSFVLMRSILTIPKLLEKFMETLPDVKEYTKQLLSISLDIALSSSDELVQSSGLIAFTYYTSFAELNSVLGDVACRVEQEKVLKLIQNLSNDSEEDTNGVLVEVLNNVIDCNSPQHLDETILEVEFDFLLTISVKDPSNIQLIVEAQECLEKLIESMDINLYNKYAHKLLPFLINVINECNQTGYSYSPLLSLALEFINILMRNRPDDISLPTYICEQLFSPLRHILMVSQEDETLQLATEAFSFLLFNSQTDVIFPYLEEIINVLSRLLSMDISDTAAMNVGSLVVTIFTKFSEQVQELIPGILRATTDKFINAKNISTSQNLVSVFCLLVCTDPARTIDFLYNLEIGTPPQSSLPLVLTKWLESFEIIRGEKKIKENILALSKIYFLKDSRVSSIEVNGDIIPYTGDLIITRSMAKSMPDKYTRVSVYQKIVKLFVAELGFQTKEQDPSDLVDSKLKQELGIPQQMGAAHGDDDDDDWEDVDDVLDYEKLQEYIDDDDEEEYVGGPESQEITGIEEVTQTTKELLIEFFKEAASKDINSFQEIYNT